MKYFLDTEFIEDGKTIDLLSLAIVADDGREFYGVNAEADHSKANDWVRENVLPHLYDTTGLPGVPGTFSRSVMRDLTLDFVRNDPKPEFWGYYADYDWVAFCQLFGTMMNLPKAFPRYCRDIKQWCDQLGNPTLPPQRGIEHHALLDARWNKAAWEFLERYANM